VKAGVKSLAKKAARKAVFGLAASAAILGALSAGHGHGDTHQSATAPVAAVTKTSSAPLAKSGVEAKAAHLTTTFHHPFYDETQSAFVEAKDLKPGDVLQTPTGTAQVTGVRLYHANTTTYDLTIGTLHTYYVEAGDTPVLVHNCKTDAELQADADAIHETWRTRYGDRAYNGTTVTTGHLDGELVYTVNRSKINPDATALAESLGYRRVFGVRLKGPEQTDAEQLLLNAVDRGEAGSSGRIATSRVACGPERQNCAGRIGKAKYQNIRVVGRWGVGTG
jgi:hypothetical protein